LKDPPPLVDIHCHLLPGVDDGAADWDEARTMAEMAVADGISTLVVTPHQLGNFSRNGGQMIRAEVARLREFLDEWEIPLRVEPGADVRIEPDMIRRIQCGEVLTLADRRRHILLELPHELYLPLDRLLPLFRAAGMVGVLSHPERNMGILAQPRVVGELVAAGCLMQVTAGALIGTFGPQVEKLAKSLVRQRLVHFVATDAHGAKSRRPLLRRAFDRVVRLAGYEAAVDLCCRNPAAVVAGNHVVCSRHASPDTRRSGWLPWSRAG